MVEVPDERQVIVQAESHLEEWLNSARTEAYVDLFEGDDPILTEADIRLLDALDSELERKGGDGVWGTGQYGIHAAGSGGSNVSFGVVCVYHPQITDDSVLRGDDGVDDETEERLNAALWQYSERVATLVDEELDEFVRRTQR